MNFNSTNSKNCMFLILFVIILVCVYSVAFLSGIGTEITMNLP